MKRRRAERQIQGSPQQHRSISVRSKYVFVLTDATARTGNIGGGGEVADSKLLGAHDRDVRNKNGKLLLGFTEDNKLALLNTLFRTSKSVVSFIFQSASKSKGQARFDNILTKQVDRRLINCINVRRSTLEATESDHNLVYAKVRIPRSDMADVMLFTSAVTR